MNTIDWLKDTYPDFYKIIEETPIETKLAVTVWVMANIVDNGKEGGSLRKLIYDRLGFDKNAYVPIYDAGGMEITNMLFE